MGQLDEAIRAHLELKRKHGASEEELQAEEQEALGPVIREAAHTESAPVDAPAEDLTEHYDPEPVEPSGLHGESLEELPPEAFHEPVEPFADDELQPPTEVLDELGPPTDPDTALSPESAEAVEEFSEHTETGEPVSALDEPDLAPPEPAAGQTPPRGFDAVQEPPPEGPEENGEDVLEETPDFLQETPEHDRLWFEQKPPRDFDFDDE